MGTPGIEHIDITSLRRTGTERVTDIREQFVDPFRSTARAPSAGKVLYVSPGDWVLPLVDPLVLPEQVEVMFAPGGRLIPIGTGAVLRIEGKITAPIGPIFITSAGSSAALTPAELATLGRVELASGRLERVYPEWWGAGRFRRVSDLVNAAELRAIANEDAEAIEMAIRTASDWRTDPVVVEFIGTYLLARTVRAGRGPFPPSGTLLSADEEPTEFHTPVNFWDRDGAEVELRGRLRSPADPTFRAHSSFTGLAMLDVRAVASLRMRSLSFDTGGSAAGCVAIRDPFQFTVTDAPHEITHCAFRGTAGAVLAGALLRMQRSHAYTAMPDATMSHAVPNFVVEACLFETTNNAGVAVRLLGDGAAAAEFRGSTFFGPAATMIHASSFEVIATGCRFHNELSPGALQNSALDAPTRARVMALHALLPQGGLDVFLDSAEYLPILLRPADPLPPSAPLPSRSLEWWEIGLGLLFPPYLIARGIYELARPTYSTITDYGRAPVPLPTRRPLRPQRSIYAQDCRSTSPQFLATAQNADHSSMADATLIGLHHEFVPLQPLVRPPAIHWRAATGENPPKLILTGCRFDNITPIMSLERVIGPSLMGAMHPAVIEYGLCDGESPTGVTAGTASVSGTTGLSATPGLFPPGTQVGYVNLR